MTAEVLLYHLTILDVTIKLEGDSLTLSPKLKLTPDLIASVRDNKQALIDLVSQTIEPTPQEAEDLNRLESILESGQFNSTKNTQTLKQYLKVYRQGYSYTLEPLLIYLDKPEVRAVLELDKTDKCYT